MKSDFQSVFLSLRSGAIFLTILSADRLLRSVRENTLANIKTNKCEPMGNPYAIHHRPSCQGNGKE